MNSAHPCEEQLERGRNATQRTGQQKSLMARKRPPTEIAAMENAPGRFDRPFLEILAQRLVVGERRIRRQTAIELDRATDPDGRSGVPRMMDLMLRLGLLLPAVVDRFAQTRRWFGR